MAWSNRIAKKQRPFNLFFILMLAYRYCRIMIALPVNYKAQLDEIRPFFASKKSTIGVAAVLTMEGAFICRSAIYSTTCDQTNDCASSYVTVIESCYTFTLLLAVLMTGPSKMCDLLNTFRSKVDFRVPADGKFVSIFLTRVLCLYVFVIVEILRKNATEYPGSTATEIGMRVFWYYTKNVAFAYDCLLLGFLYSLELNFHSLNSKLSSAVAVSQVHVLLNEHWQVVSVLKQMSDHLGPIFLVQLVYKQLLIVGMVYFTLLADLPDDGNDVLQILDTLLPTFTLSMICIQASTVISKIRRYPKFLKYRNIEITASDFIVIRAGLIIKIGAATSTSIVAISQLTPLPSNVTITD